MRYHRNCIIPFNYIRIFVVVIVGAIYIITVTIAHSQQSRYYEVWIKTQEENYEKRERHSALHGFCFLPFVGRDEKSANVRSAHLWPSCLIFPGFVILFSLLCCKYVSFLCFFVAHQQLQTNGAAI